MGHELSITLQDPRDKKYINLPSSWLLADESDVRLANNPSETEIQGAVLNAYLEKALKPLGNKKFGTVDEAVNAAIKRSEETDIKHEHKKLIPKNKEKYISEYLMSLRNIPEDVEEGMMGFEDNSERNSKMPDMDKRRLLEMLLRGFPKTEEDFIQEREAAIIESNAREMAQSLGKGVISDREMEQLRAGIDDDIYQEPITSEFHHYPERTAQDIAREEIAERDRLRERERMEFESRLRKRMGGY